MSTRRINRDISLLYRYNQRYFARALREKQLPLEAGQIPFLLRVYNHPGITQDGISAALGMDKGTTARGVRQLEQLGLIERRVDERDRRVNHVFPTDQAMGMMDRVREIVAGLHQVLYGGCTDEEIEQAVSVLRRMEQNISACVERPPLPEE